MIKRLPVFILLMVLFTTAKAQTQADTIVKHKATRAFIKYQLEDTTTKQAVPVSPVKIPVAVKPTVDTAIKKPVVDSIAKSIAVSKPVTDSVSKKPVADTIAKSAIVDKPITDSVAKKPAPDTLVKNTETAKPLIDTAVKASPPVSEEAVKPVAVKKTIKHAPVEKAASQPQPALKHSPVKTISDYRYNAYLKGDDLDSMALAGEMNHYPLPDHALKYKTQLGLNPGQISKLKALAAELHRKTIEMGENIIRNEKMLDSLFHSKKIVDGTLIFYTNRAGLYYGELRGAILMACYNTEQILSDDQSKKLAALQKAN